MKLLLIIYKILWIFKHIVTKYLVILYYILRINRMRVNKYNYLKNFYNNYKNVNSLKHILN